MERPLVRTVGPLAQATGTLSRSNSQIPRGLIDGSCLSLPYQGVRVPEFVPPGVHLIHSFNSDTQSNGTQDHAASVRFDDFV